MHAFEIRRPVSHLCPSVSSCLRLHRDALAETEVLTHHCAPRLSVPWLRGLE